jgi:hypothetical protein
MQETEEATAAFLFPSAACACGWLASDSPFLASELEAWSR